MRTVGTPLATLSSGCDGLKCSVTPPTDLSDVRDSDSDACRNVLPCMQMIKKWRSSYYSTKCSPTLNMHGLTDPIVHVVLKHANAYILIKELII